MEIWKPVPEFEEKYMVSSLGRVLNLNYRNRGVSQLCKLSIVSNYKSVFLSKKGLVKNYQVHKLVAIVFLNHIPSGHKIVVDHINNNPLDNRVENLQLITHRENTTKDRKRGTSKYLGVCWNKRFNKWVSTISFNGESNFLGTFDNEYEAHLAYQRKLKEITE